MLNGKERNGTGRRKWNEMEQIRTHTRRDSPLNGTEREGGRESYMHLRNGTDRNGKPKKNRTRLRKR